MQLKTDKTYMEKEGANYVKKKQSFAERIRMAIMYYACRAAGYGS